jgi:hypothetical protein
MADMFDKEELSIVGSLFGTSPEAMQVARERAAYTQATQAGQNLLGGILGNMAVSSERGAAGLRGAFGVQSPEERVAGIRQQATKQFDYSTPEGLYQMAEFLNQQGDATGARQAIMLAQGQQQRMATLTKTGADTVRALREPGQVNFQQLLSSGKYTPASVAKYQESQNAADLVLVKQAGEGGTGEAGPVGKSGAWRDADGTIYSASEMAKQRAGFQGLEKLAENLNMITKQDVTNSESWIDWTAGETRKQVGGKLAEKTVAAQSRINAAQLLKQIESLPPGSASNADMISAKSSFPGYGSAKALEEWIDDTKKKLTASLQRQSDQYGFKQRVEVQMGLSSGKPPTTSAPAAQSQNDPLGLRK